MFDKLKKNEPWLEWTSLKEENCAAKVFSDLFEQLKKDFELSWKWHKSIAKMKQLFPESIMLGIEFESQLGVSID